MLDIKSHVVNIAYSELSQFLQKLRTDKSLSASDLEIILTRALLDVKSEKEANTALEMINLTYRVQQLEEEKKKQAQSMQLSSNVEENS